MSQARAERRVGVVGNVTHRDTGVKFNCEDANDKEKQEKKSGEVSN